ncbi:hypothetical protein DENSPDRAFT_876464 [Dentipellis sp. KUC8613]|nr:hypothetical protein DENSPDRAFT_876464 [Dentipellis sp. KUC8613]
MSDVKKRAAPRRQKSKTGKPGQKSILDHFAVKTTESVIAETEEAPNPSSVQAETTAEGKTQPDPSPEHNATDHAKRSSPVIDIVADEDELNIRGSGLTVMTQPPAERAPPKKLFPLFEKVSRPVRTLSMPNSTTFMQDDAIIDITDDEPMPASPRASGSGSSSQPTKSKPRGRKGKKQTKSAPNDVLSSRKTTKPDQGTERKPIIIEASPVREIRITPFPSRSAVQRPPSSPTRSRHSVSHAAPFPSEETQHARGPQTEFSDAQIPFGRLPISEASGSGPPHIPIEPFLTQPSLTSFTERPTEDKLREPPEDSSTTDDSILDSTTDQHREAYPAISRFFDPSERVDERSRAKEPSQENWCEKWRPRRADQVLGNERNACYLRDWLQALRLHFDGPVAGPSSSQSGGRKAVSNSARRKRKAKRPQILREVQRPGKKRRVTVDDWIVDDDVIEEDIPISNDYDDDFFMLEGMFQEDQESTEHPVPVNPFVLGDKIHNTILLSGPPGCGKTAAVYACADELGWEVFEVYPGIGKRGSTSLDGLIGDVGRNHLVQRPRTRAEDNASPGSTAVPPQPLPSAIASFFQGGERSEAVSSRRRLHRQGTQDEPLDVDEDAAPANIVPHSQASSDIADSTAPSSQAVIRDEEAAVKELQADTTFRQSIILFEEVDILFREDAGFWPAVVKFIKECKRPVVMTCNGKLLFIHCVLLFANYSADTTLVPTEDLPLQNNLFFSSAPQSVAASFLLGLCAAEGIPVKREYCLEVITASERMKAPPDHRGLAEPGESSEHHVDLRQCINQCQFGQSAKVSQHLFHSSEAYEARDVPLDKFFDAAENVHMKPDMDSREQLRQLVQRERNADSVSALDAFCTLSHPWVLGVSTSHADDQNGYTGVEAVLRDEVAVTPEYYAQDAAMAAAAGEMLLKSINGSATSTEREGASTRHKEGTYEAEFEYALHGNVPQYAFTLQRTTVFLEYEPWIRCIMDAHAAGEAGREGTREKKGGRQTRNSQGERVRDGTNWLAMDEGRLAVLKRVGLGGWEGSGERGGG